jgi:hypothetical protein
MVEPLRHRRTKGAETDMLSLTPPRDTSTLRISFSDGSRAEAFRMSTLSGACVLCVLVRFSGYRGIVAPRSSENCHEKCTGVRDAESDGRLQLRQS